MSARLWTSLVSKFGPQKRNSKEAALRLSQAYQAVFLGSPLQEDQQLVLSDLMAKSGFQMYSPASVTDAELRHREGMRELFGHIFSHISLSERDLFELTNAARAEAAADMM